MFTKLNFFVCCFCFLVPFGHSQIVFNNIPEHMQMIPRTTGNTGSFVVSGTCPDTAVRMVRFSIRENKDSALIFNQTISVQPQTEFSINLSIPSALADYNLEIYSIDELQTETLEKKVQNLVSGDYFIVTGQSNAAGALNKYEAAVVEDSLYGNKYCRTIGNMIHYNRPDSTYDPFYDRSYHYASSFYWGTSNKGCIGIWPMRILNTLIKKTGIPLCILNGAVGATELSFHLASHTPSDPGKLRDTMSGTTFFPYDRLFRKLHVNKAVNGVKAIFWYQGESDALLSREMAQSYNKRFGILRTSWKRDYPNLEKIFVFQVNTGCAGNNMGIIRDQQRLLSSQFDDVVVVPTVGSTVDDRDEDGCHYTHQGYAKIGENMGPVALKYLYHYNLEDKYIMGPAITRIYYSEEDELCLQFNMEVDAQFSQQFYPPKEGIAYLKDYFYKEDGTVIDIEAIRSDGNNVYLKVGNYEQIKALTYLPNIFSNIPSTYTGPWILNKHNKDLGALAFFEFPVEDYTNGLRFTNKAEARIYPNPVKDYLEIRSRKKMVFNSLYLYDISGKRILDISTGWTRKTSIYLGDLEAGVYFLIATWPDGEFTQKIILTK